MILRSLSILLITSFLTAGASASTNVIIEDPLDKISNLSINFVEPNEEFIRSYKSELVNIDDTVIISLLFRKAVESSPKFSYSIYRATLTRLKEISELEYLANKTALEHLMYNTLKDLESGASKTASIDVDKSESLTCLCAGEGSCGDGSEAEQCNADVDPGLTPIMVAGGLVYASQSGNTQQYAGISSAYDSDLAATWAAREEFDAVNAARVQANQSSMDYNWTGGLLDIVSGNPYEQLNVHKAYGYGLSGDGVMVAVMDDGLCYDANDTDQVHNELKGVGKVTTYGTFTESHYDSSSGADDGTHGCHVATTIVGNYDDNSNSTAMQTEIAGHLDIDGTFSASAYDPEYSTMGVAYNSTLHFSDFGLSISDCSSECHELAIEDAKSKGAKVLSNSWGFTNDRLVTDVTSQSGDNNYAKLANWFGASLTEAEATSWIDSFNQFQESGIIVFGMSNSRAGMSETYGHSVNQTDLITSFPTLFPELGEAWISVSNTFTLADGTRVLNGAPCGGAAEWCLAHDGYNITQGTLALEGANDGSWYSTFTGSSMATPQVSGAVALLWEAFPDNSSELITKRILLTADNSWFSENQCFEDTNSDGIYSSGDSTTASCGGTTGTLTYNGISHGYNDIYGHGNPDLYAALQPIGTKSVNFGNQAYALIGTGLLLADIYGDSLSMVGEIGLYRDQLDGGFAFNLSDLVERNTRNEVHRKLQNGTHSVWSPVSHDQGLNFSYSHEADINNNGLVDDSGFYSSFVSGKNTIYVGQKYSVDQALGLRDGNNTMSVLTAHNSNESFLSFTESASSGNLIGSKIDLDNSLSFNVMAYNGFHSDYNLKEKGFLASLKHKSTKNSDFSIFIGQNNEMDGLLRTSGVGAFGNFAGETFHMGTTFNKKIANNVHLAGLFNYGLVTSSSEDAGFLSDISDLKTSQFNVGMVVSGLGKSNNLMSLNLSQPLRVESGFTNLNIPGRLDQNGNVTHTTKRLSLEPSGRELNLDLGYQMKLFNGALKVGSQLMFDAVHMESNNTQTVYGMFKTSF